MGNDNAKDNLNSLLNSLDSLLSTVNSGIINIINNNRLKKYFPITSRLIVKRELFEK